MTQPAAYPRVRLDTDHGPIVIELWNDVAPGHARNFLDLTRKGFYDGLTFHRILPDFVIQGGCPRGDGTGDPGYKVKAEFNDREHEKGVLSMARSHDPNSAGSQFFICLGREHCRHLDRQYTAFGKVVEGIGAVDKIAATKLADRQQGRPTTPPRIVKAQVVAE
jgi:peptidyl-prolyl cis-trans isomerase B (cyclophilin B)